MLILLGKNLESKVRFASSLTWWLEKADSSFFGSFWGAWAFVVVVLFIAFMGKIGHLVKNLIHTPPLLNSNINKAQEKQGYK